jgi:hypothetical protein
MQLSSLISFFIGILSVSVSIAQPKSPLLVEISPKVSGLDFVNQISENDSLHIFKYEYLYNGHGIGVADFDHNGLEDIFISGNVVANKLFLNKGKLRFDDITRKAGVEGNGAWRTGVSIADVNGDGWSDIYICHSGPKAGAGLSNELYVHQGLKNGIPVFREMAKEYGVDAPGTLSTQAAFFDYDLDGDLDLFLVNHSNHTFNPYLNTSVIRSVPSPAFGNRLFRNDRSEKGVMKFGDVTQAAGIVNNALNFGLSVVVSDLNKDGWPDLYTSSDYTEQDYCYINQKNGTFRQTLQQSFTHISKFSMGADIADFNNDGWPDVFTLDMMPEDNYRQKLLKGPDEYDAYHLLLDSGYYHQQMRNMLHLNRGTDPNGIIRFSEIGQLAGVSNTDWSWSSLFVDLDNDGWKDLLVTNGYLRDYTDNDFLKYTVADAQLKEAAKGNLNFRTYDLVKQMPSNKLQNYLFRNKHDLSFENVSTEWGLNKKTVSNCAVYADLDNDGDMDLVIGNNNEPVQLFENRNREIGRGNYLQVQLKGLKNNPDAIGSKVYLYTNDPANPVQLQEVYPVRGYQSSVSTILHFGLDGSSKVDSIRIEWVGGGDTLISVPKVNTRLQVQQHGSAVVSSASAERKYIFEDITAPSNLHFQHEENEFVDFKVEVLLPYQLSRMGPALATGDVNGDELEDVFVGGAIGQSGTLFIQLPQSKFIRATVQPWEADKTSEDVKAMFLDLNGDGFKDLYVVSGGNEYESGASEYRDRVYVNDGEGNFSFAPDALPKEMNESKNAVAAADIDKDGDLDLFIGGACVPGSFPEPTRSYLLRNDSKGKKILFTDITRLWSDALVAPGIIHDVVFRDLDTDGDPDLLLAGEWMPLKAFRNNGSGFQDISGDFGFEDSGMWTSLLVDDLNGDGYADILAGNAGNNLQFKASREAPVSLIVTDLDDNGANEVLFSYYIQGKLYPAASRDELLDQVVPLRKKYVKYHQYASVEIKDLVDESRLKAAKKWMITEMNHLVYLSDGKGKYISKKLPQITQSSRIFSMLKASINSAGQEYLLAGNFFPWRTQWGQNDSGLGSLLSFSGDQMIVAENRKAGLFIDGDVRGMAMIKNSDQEKLIIVVKNNEAVQVLKLSIK